MKIAGGLLSQFPKAFYSLVVTEYKVTAQGYINEETENKLKSKRFEEAPSCLGGWKVYKNGNIEVSLSPNERKPWIEVTA